MKALRLAAFAAFALFSACSSEELPAKRSPDLLLITVDTLRADHLGFYGYERPTSTHLDRFAAQSVVFDHAVAQSSWTLASLGSMLTSKWVGELGIRDFRSRLDESAVTLAEILSASGYDTGAVGSHIVFLDKYGLRQGFADFDDDLVYRDFGRSHRAISSKQVSDKGIDWIEARRESTSPWFLWLHYFDPHQRYQEHDRFKELFDPGPIGLYDGEIAFTDAQIGRVLRRARTPKRRLVTLFTADHGEELGDHGGKSHGHTLYQELIHVPLVISAPGLEPARIGEQVSLVDVLPTLLELLEVPPELRPSGLVGQSLLPLMRGADLEPRPILSELRFHRDTHTDALTRGRWKLIVPQATNLPELYDLADDGVEQKNLAELHPEVVESMREELELLTAGAWPESEDGADRLELDSAELEALHELGYAGDD